MRIIRFEAEGFKRLKVVAIAPTGNVVEITGRNGQGKTSVLDALWAAIAGASVIQPAPINRDAESARIMLDLGEIVITRTLKREKDGPGFTTKLVVESAEGARFNEPQRMLDRLFGTLSFDPLEFARMKPREQFDALRQFVPGVDFDLIDRQQKGDFEKRAELNRRAKEARGFAGGITYPADTPAEPIDTADLVEQMNAAIQSNAALVAETQRRAGEMQHASHLWEEARELERRAATLKAEGDRIARAVEALPALAAPLAVDDMGAQLKRAGEVNNAVASRKARADHEMRAKQYERDAEALTEAMGAREIAKRDAIAAAKMPVEGLDFGDNCVLLAGVPFEQGSDAERLRASVAIAMAANPKLRVIRIRDGSLLDAGSRALLEQMAEQYEMQVWIETVSNGQGTGIIIEDGEVAHAEA